MNNFDKKILITATLLAAITIAMGAFGAHGLKNLVDEASIRGFETGVRYQMYHVIALVIIGVSIFYFGYFVVFWIDLFIDT